MMKQNSSLLLRSLFSSLCKCLTQHLTLKPRLTTNLVTSLSVSPCRNTGLRRQKRSSSGWQIKMGTQPLNSSRSRQRWTSKVERLSRLLSKERISLLKHATILTSTHTMSRQAANKFTHYQSKECQLVLFSENLRFQRLCSLMLVNSFNYRCPPIRKWIIIQSLSYLCPTQRILHA